MSQAVEGVLCYLFYVHVDNDNYKHRHGSTRQGEGQGWRVFPFIWGSRSLCMKKGEHPLALPFPCIKHYLIWKEHAERTFWMEGLHYLNLILHSKYFSEGHFSSLLVKKLLSLRPVPWKCKSVAGWSLLQGNVASSYIHTMTEKKLLDNLPLPPALVGSMSYFHG
jgi:hypothetical protein